MRAAILAVGTELLFGAGADSNSATLGARLFDLGIDVRLKVSVGDDVDEIASMLRDLARWAEVVITVGGLGPTLDDVTREGAAKALGCGLVRDEVLEAELREHYRDLDVTPTETALRQADLLEGAEALPAVGTAPGQVLEHRGRLYALLPGVPSEMATMLEDSLVPWLKRARRLSDARRLRRIRMTDLTEIDVERRLRPVMAAHPDIGLSVLVYPEEVHALLYLPMGVKSDVPLDRVVALAEEALGEAVFGKDSQSMEATVVGLLAAAQLTLATAESCTGGLVAKRVTDVAGSSAVFRGGVVAYSDEAKRDWLSVPGAMLQQYGAVSSPVASEMAANIRLSRRASYGVGVTGIAGPSGGFQDKPVGLTYVALAGAEGVTSVRRVLTGDRVTIRRRASQVALDMVRRAVAAHIANGGRQA